MDKKEEIKELGPKKVDFNHLFEVNTTKFSAWLQNGSISAGFELVRSRTEKPRIVSIYRLFSVKRCLLLFIKLVFIPKIS